MLFAVDTGKIVTTIPHKREFERWKKNISASDYQNVVDAINEKVDKCEINTVGWMPGSDWSGTVYEPLYIACGCNKDAAGMFFGLIVFDTLMNRTDKTWGFGRYEKDGVPIRSMTYFEIDSI